MGAKLRCYWDGHEGDTIPEAITLKGGAWQTEGQIQSSSSATLEFCLRELQLIKQKIIKNTNKFIFAQKLKVFSLSPKYTLNLTHCTFFTGTTTGQATTFSPLNKCIESPLFPVSAPPYFETALHRAARAIFLKSNLRDFSGGAVDGNLPANAWGWSLVREDATCLRASRPMRHNYWSPHA